MNRRAIILTVVLILAAITVFAQHPSRAPQAQRASLAPCHETGMNIGFIRPGMLLRMADEIGLDEKQKAQIDKLAQDNGLKRIEMKADLEKAQLKLKHMKMNDAPDADVLKMFDDIGRMKTEMHKSAYVFHQAVKGLLTAEQLEKARELHGAHGQGKFPFCPGDGPGGHKGHGRSFVPDSDTEHGYHGGFGR